MQTKLKGVRYCSCGGILHPETVEHNKIHKLTFLRCHCGKQSNYIYFLHGARITADNDAVLDFEIAKLVYKI